MPFRHSPVAAQQPSQFEGPHTAFVHALLVQVAVPTQVTQPWPPVPHAAFEVPAEQTPFWQQPVVHVEAEQPLSAAQTPPWHERPLPHPTHALPFRPQAAFPLPDWQTLLTQHPALHVELLQGVATHWPKRQVVPSPH